MPRIRPFTDFELDPVDRPIAAWTPSQRPSGDTPAEPRVSGRHSSPPPAEPQSAGGRRRRADDSENDVLAKILERETRS